MQKIFLILILVSFFSNEIRSQNLDTFKISGKVISSFSNTAIHEAAITYLPTKGVLTDSLGVFRISNLAKGSYNLKFSAYGYNSIDTTFEIVDKNIDFIWKIKTLCNGRFTKDAAIHDLNNKKANLLIQGGIGPIVLKTDKMFKKKFNVGYSIFGCEAPDMKECLEEYNKTVIKYLDIKYGNKWRREVRKDVIGLTD